LPSIGAGPWKRQLVNHTYSISILNVFSKTLSALILSWDPGGHRIVSVILTLHKEKRHEYRLRGPYKDPGRGRLDSFLESSMLYFSSEMWGKRNLLLWEACQPSWLRKMKQEAETKWIQEKVALWDCTGLRVNIVIVPQYMLQKTLH
jgi:hypothetical protein